MDAYISLFVWGGIFIITVAAEILSQQLISIWFAAGSLAAFIAACLHASSVTQSILFLIVSILLLICTRPIVKKIFQFQIENTNSQEIGKVATVIQKIDGENQTGRVRLNGVDWTAISQDGTVIAVDDSVRVVAVDGSKLIVCPVKIKEETTV